MNSRRFLSIHGGFLATLLLASCVTTEDYSDFELKKPESDTQKADRLWFESNLTKQSSFQGKQFEGKEANLRSEFERKEYPEHPYFQLRKDRPLRKGNDYFKNDEAREGSQTAAWQEKENSWFKKAFAKRDARQSFKQVERKEFRLPDKALQTQQRSGYENQRFWGQIIDEPKKDKPMSIDDVKELLNTY